MKKKIMSIFIVMAMFLSISTVFAAWSPDMTGSPAISNHSHGYFIWRDNSGIHVKMISEENASFSGSIQTDGQFRDVSTRNIEDNGNVQVENHNNLKFKAKRVTNAEMDFNIVDSDSITFELFIDGKKVNPKNIYLGKEEWHPTDNSFSVYRDREFAEDHTNDRDGDTGTNSLEASFNRFHFGYIESIGDSESGWLNGFHVAYKSQDPVTKEFWRLNYEQTKQNTQYNGAIEDLTTNTSTPYKGITEDTITNSEFIYAIPITKDKNTYIYTGIGNYIWDRNLTGQYGYLEKYNWNYVPVGYRNEFNISGKLNGAVDLVAKFMFNGNIDVSGNGSAEQQMILGNKVGFRVELPYTYKMNSNWALTFTPWYEYSAIGQSNSVYSIIDRVRYVTYEPDSMNHQYGSNIGLQYTF